MSADARRCIKCGREVGPDESLCPTCNRAGMVAPSASQYHGTVVVAIVFAIAGLAIAASLALRGVGPYVARPLEIVPAPPNAVEVTLSVSNQGTRAGRAKCRILALDAHDGRLASQSIVSPQLAGGEEITLVERVPGLLQAPDSVTIDCT